MQDLRAQIRQLEADNASLVTAAEQAAALAEEYAADAAKYRAANNSSQTALVNELTDATRRKDRRIQRLNTLLDNEKKRAEELERRVEELEEIEKDSVENAKNTAVSSRSLDDRPVPLSGSALPAPSPAPVKALSALESILPPDVRGIFAAFRVFFISESVLKWTAHIAHASKSEVTGESFANLAKLVDETARRSVAWCFASPPDLAERGIMLQKGMSSLQERVEALSNEIAEGESHRWTLEYARMKQDLVGMPIEVLKSVVPASWTRLQKFDEMDFHEICIEQARHMKTILTTEEREVQKKAVDALNSKLNAVRLTLEQKSKELDDLRVRTSIFEGRLESSRKDKDIIEELRAKVASLGNELAEAKITAEKNDETKSATELPSVKVEKDTLHTETAKLAVHPSPHERAKRMSETSRLRRMLIRSQLADLHPVNSLSEDAEVQLRETVQVRNAVSKALKDARIAASMASVVQLDPETLKPKVEGATMSRKTILQSLGVLEKQAAVSRFQRDLSRYSTLRKAGMCDEAGLINTLTAVMHDMS